MRKAIVIIECENGSHKTSIIRTVSQILIGLRHTIVLNIEELGLTGDIDSIVQVDNMKIGVASQNDLSKNTVKIVEQLQMRGCDFILCATQNNPTDLEELKSYADQYNFNFIDLKSHWSEKLEVNYLIEEQVNEILLEISRVHKLLNVIHQ